MNINDYIKKKQWRIDLKEKRKVEIKRDIEKIKKSTNVVEKLGIIMFYNQLVEEMIKEIIILSYAFILIKLKPKKINFDINFDNLTFGGLVNKFEHSCVIKYNFDILVCDLKEMNKLRNMLTHKLMMMKNNNDILKYLNSYCEAADESFMLLIEYYSALSEDIEYLNMK